MHKLVAVVALALLFFPGGITQAENVLGEQMKKTNRLAGSRSPYLLQHADNPVDWWPWGPDAFAAAREQDKPIFLSIGYATCHWCHVMEHESFEDPEVADLMNSTFINIKVDREERPDIDQVYMTVCQMLTGSGGWPLTIIMTPDQKPFFAATYIPKRNRFGRTGMMELIPKVADAWRGKRDALETSAEEIVASLRSASEASRSGKLGKASVDAAFHEFKSRFDRELGGFGDAPKFPSPHNLLFLLAYGEHTDNREAVEMVKSTLENMRRGGIYDQIGFGFHRYSTDREWLVPHFEKMLYDQAMLVLALSEAFRLTGREEFAETVREVLSYIERDMTSAGGAFFSAEDADSEGEEGIFYFWTEEELIRVLGKDDAALAESVWNTSATGNFIAEASDKSSKDNILHLDQPLADTAEDLGMPTSKLKTRVEAIRGRLLTHREKRVRPLLDDKILTDWNALMAAAAARAGHLLEHPEYVELASRNVDFIFARMRAKNGRLLHRLRGDKAEIPAFLDDHVFLVWALLNLYDATLDSRHLERAVAIQRQTDDLFRDEKGGGYFFAAEDNESLLIRSKEVYDGALPSGNSVAVHNLVRLARLTGVTDFEDKAEKILKAFGAQASRAPSAHAHLIHGLHRAVTPSVEVVIVGDRQEKATAVMLREVRDHAPAGAAVLLVEPGAAGERMRRIAPFTSEFQSIEGASTAYVCRDRRCLLPTTDVQTLKSLLTAENGSP